MLCGHFSRWHIVVTTEGANGEVVKMLVGIKRWQAKMEGQIPGKNEKQTKMSHVMSWFLETLRRGSLNLAILNFTWTFKLH